MAKNIGIGNYWHTEHNCLYCRNDKCVYIYMDFCLLYPLTDNVGYKVFSSDKNKRAIIIYEKEVWLDEPEYNFGIMRNPLFFEKYEEGSPNYNKVNFSWDSFNPEIIWTEDTAMVHMPDGEIINVNLN